jgi:glycosyltransferase involved in cell wall biosynthesis
LSRFVVLTQEDRVLWTELDNVEIIPNPIAFVPSVFSTCTNHHVIAVGRYVPQKGFDMLITAWAQVVAVCPDWKLHIWGEGELREQLQSQIDGIG